MDFQICISLQIVSLCVENLNLLKKLQGGWETDESITEAASRETLEEAGVRGIVQVYFSLCFSKIHLRFLWFSLVFGDYDFGC